MQTDDFVHLSMIAFVLVVVAMIAVSPGTMWFFNRQAGKITDAVESRSRRTMLTRFVVDGEGWSHLHQVEVLKEPKIPRQLRTEAYKTMLSLIGAEDSIDRFAWASLRLNKKWAQPVEEWTVAWMLRCGEESWTGCTSWAGDSTVDSWKPDEDANRFSWADEHDEIPVDATPSFG